MNLRSLDPKARKKSTIHINVLWKHVQNSRANIEFKIFFRDGWWSPSLPKCFGGKGGPPSPPLDTFGSIIKDDKDKETKMVRGEV